MGVNYRVSLDPVVFFLHVEVEEQGEHVGQRLKTRVCHWRDQRGAVLVVDFSDASSDELLFKVLEHRVFTVFVHRTCVLLNLSLGQLLSVQP